jgi:hypothetical protein
MEVTPIERPRILAFHCSILPPRASFPVAKSYPKFEGRDRLVKISERAGKALDPDAGAAIGGAAARMDLARCSASLARAELTVA